MVKALDKNGDPLPDHSRITPLGNFLRRTSLDELPELWNVLKGEMSLVGPRPLLTEYLRLYTSIQSRRHEVRPGVTGWAQIHGRNATTWEKRLALDVWYVDNRTLLLDLSIILRTLLKVLLREGINQDGEATMERFYGSAV
jgi:lipopolysaccharide/colanic/teichoic acid biosynthesis glycosyltransferase